MNSTSRENPIQPDAMQRIAASPSVSSWVSASAGTGKTYVLTNRVLRLLLEGTPAFRILCLTFTKAAAAEMANRLNARLGHWAVADDDELRGDLFLLVGQEPDAAAMTKARRLFAEVLDAPGGLKIQTIHAFCESLLGRFPLEAGIASHFQVSDERTAEELLREAQNQVLRRDIASGEGLIERLAGLADEASFTGLMRLISGERGRLRRLLARHGGIDALIERLRSRLGLSADEQPENIAGAAVSEGVFDRPGLRAAVDVMFEGAKTTVELAQRLADWLALDENARAAGFDAYLGIFFTAKGTPRKNLLNKKMTEAHPIAAAALLVEQERLAAVRDRMATARIAAATTCLLRLGDQLIDAYEDAKRRHAWLDYDDLILAVRDLLARPGIAPWVLFKLDGGLDHILIDEAQDTNPDQWEVVRALAGEFFSGEGARLENRTIFAVGDLKQSIYSFQRADPDAFVDMRAHFAAQVQAAEKDWRPVDLDLSFRSTPAVLRAVDAVFAQEDAADGVNFTDKPLEHRANRAGAGGCVEIWEPIAPPERPPRDPWTPPLQQEFAASPARLLAERIAGRIRHWLDAGETLAASGQPIRPGDVLILVRSRDPFVEDMVRALRTLGIPVAGVDRMALSEQLAVMDLVALGKFLLLPEDDLTLAVVLKGPLIGFDDELLFQLAHKRPGGLWRGLLQRQNENPEFARAVELLRPLLAQADFATPFGFYAELLGAHGGRRKLLARLGHEANDPLDEFLAKALEFEQSHVPSLQGFLSWITSGSEEVKRDADRDLDEVRIMTIHGAKGLQAPIVFLPDTAGKPQHRTQLFWLPDDDSAGGAGNHLPIWSPARDLDDTHARRAREESLRRQGQEYRRLLYVAMTRAADRLYICAQRGSRELAADCWYELMARALKPLVDPIEMYDGKVWRLESPQNDAVVNADAAVRPAAASSLPEWLSRPAPPVPSPPRPLAPSRPSLPEAAMRRPLEAADAEGGPEATLEVDRFKRGNIIHRLLQLLPTAPEDRRAALAEQFLRNPSHGLAAAEITAWRDEVLAVLDHPDYVELFSARGRAEVPLCGLVRGQVGDDASQQVISGQIDRLLVSDSRIIAVDYKSNRPPPADVAAVPRLYLRQMAAYRALLRQIYPGKTIHCGLLWTDGPNLMLLPEDLLDANMP